MSFDITQTSRRKIPENSPYLINTIILQESKNSSAVENSALSNAEILRPQKIGRTTYFINYQLMQILAS
ncbi:Fic/DOC family N-terminal domain-containing protein [Puia dinghuensis]|uniref:Fic/DOC family N-terminal domain-containing protein n=1 Tax=Puia dinghuensis TaxID=1792502 RepID=UPI003570E269